MGVRGVVAGCAGALVLVLPAAALAGTVTLSGGTITYQAEDATNAAENVDLAVDGGGTAFVVSNNASISTSNCTATSAASVDCGPFGGLFLVNFLEFDDAMSAEVQTGPAAVEAHGGAGDDRLSGTPNADRLFGDAGGDNLGGGGGNDTLDGGPGENFHDDGAGDDTITGGPGNDTLIPGPGRDTFTGGDGDDIVDYRGRTAGVTITLDGRADDGEAGEGDNVAADVENVVGGSGPDRIVAGAAGARLTGGPGNDSITGSPQEDRVDGLEGDDTIDTRDGRYDSIDCGSGNDTLLADPGDDAENCEVAPDRDGDGTLNEADCQPDNAAVHPAAGEIVGNDVDEDCAGGPGFLRVEAGISLRLRAAAQPAADPLHDAARERPQARRPHRGPLPRQGLRVPPHGGHVAGAQAAGQRGRALQAALPAPRRGHRAAHPAPAVRGQGLPPHRHPRAERQARPALPQAGPVDAAALRLAGAAGDPLLRRGEVGHREHARLPGDHPREQPRRVGDPVQVGDDRRALPPVVVPDAEVEAQLRIGPQRARLDALHVLDQVQRPQRRAALHRRLQRGHEQAAVVLTGDVAGRPEAQCARRHPLQLLDHARTVRPGGGQPRQRTPEPVKMRAHGGSGPSSRTARTTARAAATTTSGWSWGMKWPLPIGTACTRSLDSSASSACIIRQNRDARRCRRGGGGSPNAAVNWAP